MVQRDCTTVNVQAPHDESTADIVSGSVTANSPEPNQVSVSYQVRNNVTSGDGVSLQVDVNIEVDGSTVTTETLTVSPGSTVNPSLTLTGVSAGSRQICAAIANTSPAG